MPDNNPTNLSLDAITVAHYLRLLRKLHTSHNDLLQDIMKTFSTAIDHTPITDYQALVDALFYDKPANRNRKSLNNTERTHRKTLLVGCILQTVGNDVKPDELVKFLEALGHTEFTYRTVRYHIEQDHLDPVPKAWRHRDNATIKDLRSFFGDWHMHNPYFIIVGDNDQLKGIVSTGDYYANFEKLGREQDSARIIDQRGFNNNPTTARYDDSIESIKKHFESKSLNMIIVVDASESPSHLVYRDLMNRSEFS